MVPKGVMVLALTRDDVRRLVPMADAVELMKTALAELSAGYADSPLRTVLRVAGTEPGTGTDALFMPASVPATGALGLKMVAVSSGNPARGLPLIHAVVVLADPETGQPLAIVDGTYLTALRTGAVSGAATDLLARRDSRTLVVFGAGAQARTQAAAVHAVRDLTRIIVVAPRPEGLARFREAMVAEWPKVAALVETTSDPGAVAEADIVCAATTSRTPVFDDALLRPGSHVNAVGAYTPAMQEIPAATVRRATVVVDVVEAAMAEAGDLVIPLKDGTIGPEHIRRELGQVVAGTAPGRESAEEVTFFKSVGNAVQDVVVARRALDRALELGVGQKLNLG